MQCWSLNSFLVRWLLQRTLVPSFFFVPPFCRRVCMDMHGCANVCGMNFQNFFRRIESLHQRTLICILYEFFSLYFIYSLIRKLLSWSADNILKKIEFTLHNILSPINANKAGKVSSPIYNALALVSQSKILQCPMSQNFSTKKT